MYHVEIGEILLSEGHPEACLANGGVVLYQAFKLFVVHQVAFARTNIGVGDGLMHGQRFGFEPLSVFVVQALLGYLAYVNLWIEVGCEGLVVVTGVAVDDVEIVNFVEMVLGSVCRVDAAYARIEPTAKNGGEPSLFKALLVGPLPRVFEVRLVFGFVVGGV